LPNARNIKQYGNGRARCLGWPLGNSYEQKFVTLKRHMMADVAQARDALKRAGKAFPKLGEV